MASNVLNLSKLHVDSKTNKVYFKYENLLSLPEFPEGPLVELFQGELYMVPSPSLIHQKIALRLGVIFHSFCENFGGEVYLAPVDVILSEDTVVIPDICFVANNNTAILKQNNIKGVPDIIIEIISSNRKRDEVDKLKLYQNARVPIYLIAYPEEKQIALYEYNQGKGSFLEKKIYQQGATMQILSYGFELSIDKVFERSHVIK